MILITGSTGFIGRHLVARLLREDKRVRLLLPAHKVQNLPWDNPPEIVVGTLTDEETVFQAMNGVNTVIHLESAQWWGTEKEMERLEVAGTRKLVEAARTARVGRVIILSHLGATSASAYPLIRVKGKVEEIVRGSGLAYTIIRPGLVFGKEDAFFNHIAMLLNVNPVFFFMPGQGEVVLHPIYIDDLVEVLMQTLENIDTVDEAIDIGGPEYITLSDLIATIMRVSGDYRTVVSIPPYLLRWLNSLSSLFVRRTLVTRQWLDVLATNRVAKIGTMPRYFDVNMHRLEDTLLTYLPEQNTFADTVRYTFQRHPRSFKTD